MRDNITIGLVSPQSTDRVPTTGPQMYPGVKFIAKGVGVKALTPEGYDSAWDGIVPAAEELAKQNRLDAIMVIGTSLTFYRGFEAHEKLLERFGAAAEKSEDDIIALAGRVSANATEAEGMLISCGGLRTLQIGKTIEDKYGLPMVSSTPAAFWAAMRLAGESGKLPGYGKLFEPVH